VRAVRAVAVAVASWQGATTVRRLVVVLVAGVVPALVVLLQMVWSAGGLLLVGVV
jgi:hypothetical protein